MKPSQQKNDSTREDTNVKTDQRRKKLVNPSANQIGKNKKKETKTAQVVELHLGTTVLPLKDARGVLSLIEQLKTDQKYSATLGFLSDLFRKLNTLEDGQFSRIEIDMTVRQYQDYTDGFQYRLTVKPVGYCLLITNSEFYQVPGCPISKKLPNRPGVEGDAKRLEGLMSTIGYKVLRKDNLKKWEIEREMKAMAEADHKKFDCFVCIISSHGTANKVYGSDGYDLMLGPQLKRFTVDACPDLDGKPKIFLFQACNIETEDKMQKTLQPLINETDFLYGFSTLPGNLAYNPKDREKTGSYYLYSLYKHLSDKYKACDLVAILEDMNRELAEKKSELRPGDLGSVTMFVDCLRVTVVVRKKSRLWLNAPKHGGKSESRPPNKILPKPPTVKLHQSSSSGSSRKRLCTPQKPLIPKRNRLLSSMNSHRNLYHRIAIHLQEET